MFGNQSQLPYAIVRCLRRKTYCWLKTTCRPQSQTDPIRANGIILCQFSNTKDQNLLRQNNFPNGLQTNRYRFFAPRSGDKWRTQSTQLRQRKIAQYTSMVFESIGELKYNIDVLSWHMKINSSVKQPPRYWYKLICCTKPAEHQKINFWLPSNLPPDFSHVPAGTFFHSFGSFCLSWLGLRKEWLPFFVAQSFY